MRGRLAEFTEVIGARTLQHFDMRCGIFVGELSSVVFVFSALVFFFFSFLFSLFLFPSPFSFFSPQCSFPLPPHCPSGSIINGSAHPYLKWTQLGENIAFWQAGCTGRGFAKVIAGVLVRSCMFLYTVKRDTLWTPTLILKPPPPPTGFLCFSFKV